MATLLTADLHLTDNPRDEYRWGILPWLVKQAEVHQVDQIMVLGDLTDAKDRHSSALVNRVVRNLSGNATGPRWIFIKGNHDYIDESLPFFEFLEFHDNVRFFNYPSELTIKVADTPEKCLFLPNTKNWREDWQELYFNDYPFIFTHQTYEGCLTENGTTLEGIPPSIFKDFEGHVYSGDIHVPQKVARNVEYVGAPYHLRFGDVFNPRVLLIDNNGRCRNLRFACQGKYLINCSSVDELVDTAHAMEVKRGDQVKVRVSLHRAEYPNWSQIKAAIRTCAGEQGWHLFGPELVALDPIPQVEGPQITQSSRLAPVEMVKTHGEKVSLDEDTVQIGLSLIQKAGN